jgi:hypothetical protein
MRIVTQMWLLLLAAGAELPAAVSGRVVDATTGEGLANVSVRAGELRTVTDPEGRFRIEDVDAAGARLEAVAIGYRRILVAIPAGGAEVEVALQPDTLRRSEALTVEAGPFATEEPQSQSLAGSELRNLASVLADDPLRAVQSLPGVASGDDFQAQFSLRGAAFTRIGLYIDGILLRGPFHAVQGDDSSASLAAFQGEMLESANLYSAAMPPRFQDRGAGALDLRVRDGDTRRTAGRASVGASNASLSAEGPFAGRGSWIAAVRKSYLQYIINRTSDDPGLAFGFWDTQARLAYSVTSRHQTSLTLMHAGSGLDRTGNDNVGVNSLFRSAYDYSLAYAGWRYTPDARLVISHQFGYLREKYANRNRNDVPLATDGYREWIGMGNAWFRWREGATLEGGWQLRTQRNGGDVFRIAAGRPVRVEDYLGTAARYGFYLQHTAQLGGVEVRIGGRLDDQTLLRRRSYTPFAAVTAPLWKAAQMHLAWSQAVQYPEIRQTVSFPNPAGLSTERAQHFTASIDQAIGERTRVRLEGYQRRDRNLLFRPLGDPRRLTNGALYLPPLNSIWYNSLRGRSSGFVVSLQRRAANGFTGWISYAYGHARMEDARLGSHFPADFDVTHIVSIFGSYRLRPTVNLSAKSLYSTGAPLRGFFEVRGTEYFLAGDRNRVRLPAYARTDFRINKTFAKQRYRWTLFAEVINIANRRNLRFDDFGGVDTRTGRIRVFLNRTFPVIPSAGALFEF